MLHPDTRIGAATTQRPAERNEDEHVDRDIFEQVDGVGHQRDLAQPQCHHEFDREVGEVQKRHPQAGTAEFPLEVRRTLHALIIASECGWGGVSATAWTGQPHGFGINRHTDTALTALATY